jgi:hypothetical protein
MPQAAEPQDEPDWVKRLRARGFDVRGGAGNLPLEPRVSFPPMPRRRVLRMLYAVLRWLKVP